MEFRILGPLEVLEDGRQVGLGGAKQRALLAVLLLHANEVVSTDTLFDALWEDEIPETGRKALQVYVSQLRKAIGRERLQTRAPGYLLRVEEDELDLERFRRLAGAGKFAEALALWRGQALSDFTYQRFAQSEIGRIEALRLACIEDGIDVDLAAGRHATLVGELEMLVAKHPLRERLRAQLMLALYRAGRQAEALQAYHDARHALVEDLGIEPSPELRELQRAVLEQDPMLDLVPAPVDASESSEGSRGVFVGREHEMAELGAALDDAFAGRGALVLLVGEPGIGKSRLAEELVRQARSRGARVLVGRCWEAGGAPAYWPWVQSLRAHIEQSDRDALRAELGGGAAEVAQIVPEVRDLLPDLAEPSLEEEGARFRLFDAVARFLRNVASNDPLVLVLDDLHAADEPSLLMLRFLAGELGESRILLVGTYRDVDPTVRGPLAATLAELVREQVTRRIDLQGLALPDVARFIELDADVSPPAELVAAIHGETEGNPLFVGEVVRLLASEGRLSKIDAGALWALGIPQGVREVIGRRIGRLTPECSRVLTLAAVLGREFELDALEHLSELGSDELLDVLDEAIASKVLASVPGAPGHLRFAHALIRETLYDQLTTVRRGQLHRRAGEALEGLYELDPEPHLAELAYHFFEAAPGGDVEKALDYARRAGARALELLAYEEAARFYQLALQALDLRKTFDRVERCELLLALGDPLARAGNTAEAKETFLAAADLARTAGLPDQLARAALGYGGRFPWLRAGNDTQLVPLLQEAMQELGDEESSLRVRVLARLAGALRDEPSLEPRSSLSRQAVEIARRLGDTDTLAYALVSLAPAIWGPNFEEFDRAAEEVSELARTSGNPEFALLAGWLNHIRWMTRGDVEQVEALGEADQARANALKQPSQQWYSSVRRGVWALFEGRFDDAERLAGEALRFGGRAVAWDAGCSHRFVLFMLRREQDRLDEIDALIRLSVDEYPGYRSFRCFVVLIDCELGREEHARRKLDDLARDDFSALPRDGEWLFCLSLMAEAASYLDDRERAATLYRLLAPYANLNALAAGEVASGSVSRYLGLLAAVMGQGEARRHFEDALEANVRMGARSWVAHTQHDFARMLLTTGQDHDQERALELLHAARSTAEELGMPALLRRMAPLEAQSV